MKKKSDNNYRGKHNRQEGIPRNSPAVKPGSESEGMRLNKYVAQCGICSRRQAADYVKQGLIEVNRKVIREPGYQMQPGDIVAYKGKPIKAEARKVYYLMNKPKNTITTLSDDRGRKTVMDLVKNRIKERVFPVGRLDRATTGLLVLTNDGALAQKMMHPSHEMRKVYHVQLDRDVKKEDLEKIRQTLHLEDGPAPVDAVTPLEDKGPRWVTIELHIGRNRIVRRIFEHLGYEVYRLDRVYLGGLTKKGLPRGFVRPLNKREILMIKHFSSKQG